MSYSVSLVQLEPDARKGVWSLRRNGIMLWHGQGACLIQPSQLKNCAA